jgi:hypothetical protein
MISQAKIRGFLAENRTFAEEKRIENVQYRTRLIGSYERRLFESSRIQYEVSKYSLWLKMSYYWLMRRNANGYI